MKCSAKEGKCYEVFRIKGKMVWNVQQKMENGMECSAKEGKCSAKEGKCSAKEGKCYEMFSKREKML